MMPLHSSKAIGDSRILQKKVPSTRRYSDVKSRIDTGSSMTRYMRKIEDMQSNYRFKNNELFRRMKGTTLAQLILQVANVSVRDNTSLEDSASPRSASSSWVGSESASTSLGTLTPDDVTIKYSDDETEPVSSRSSLQSVIRGIGEVDIADDKKPLEKEIEVPHLHRPYEECPYLILDVRDSDAYKAGHITGAKNFPIAMLSRTMNNFTKEILAFKNCPGRIMILYDEDERIATVAATTMVERGFDNIFILSGGLKVLGKKIPEGILNGPYPGSCQITRMSRSSFHHPVDARKQRFSSEDLDKIHHHLEESLVPQDTGSRLSRRTNNSRNSSKTKTGTCHAGAQRAWR